jgi:hypothetical protein
MRTVKLFRVSQTCGGAIQENVALSASPCRASHSRMRFRRWLRHELHLQSQHVPVLKLNEEYCFHKKREEVLRIPPACRKFEVLDRIY